MKMTQATEEVERCSDHSHLKRIRTYICNMWLRNSGLWNVLMPLALVAFLIGSLPLSWMHSAVHVHEHEHLHTDTAEADPCHRAIYHGDRSHNCEHKNHLTEQFTDCELCKVLTSRSLQFIGTSVVEIGAFSFSTQDFHFGSDFVLEPSPLRSSLRGPPTA